MNQTLKTAYRGLRRRIGNTLRNSPLNFQAEALLQMKQDLLLSEKTSVAS